MQNSKKAGLRNLILDPAQRGRQRLVTSAPFNAARVRDREKWIHHHQFFVAFKPMNSYCLLGKYLHFTPQHFQNYKRQESKF